MQGAPDDAQGAAAVEGHLVHDEGLRPLPRLRRRGSRQQRYALLRIIMGPSLSHPNRSSDWHTQVTVQEAHGAGVAKL